MRHKNIKYHLGRSTSFRRATLISLMKSLFLYQSIKTTKTRALAVKPWAEKLISMGKQGTLAAKRRANKVLNDHKLVSLLFNDIAERFSKRSGGYTRILNLGVRRGDNAKLVILELTEIKKIEKKQITKEKESKPKEEAAQITEEPITHEERKHKPQAEPFEKPPITKKPAKKFLGNLRSIFKKERDSL